MNNVKWLLNSKSHDEEPPEEVFSVKKYDMFTHACTVEDLSDPVAMDKREIIIRLSGLLEAKTLEVIRYHFPFSLFSLHNYFHFQ